MEGVKGAQGPITGNKGEVDSLWRVDVGAGDVFALNKQTQQNICIGGFRINMGMFLQKTNKQTKKCNKKHNKTKTSQETKVK